VLRQDLIRDYREHVESLPLVRGRVQPLPTTRAYLTGRIAIECEFAEFDADNPLNRVLLAAAQVVAGSPLLNTVLRQRARRVSLRLDGIGTLRPADLRVGVDRRTSYYRDALTLASSVLSGGGRTLEAGPEPAWTFLIRTPEMIEEGIRGVLRDGLRDSHLVTNKGQRMNGTTKTLNPDLVFDSGAATGDVKYKLTGTEWKRDDLYQAVAFAAGYRTTRALVITFSPSGEQLPTLNVGDIEVTNLTWDTSPRTSPDEAAELLTAAVRSWLEKPPTG